MSNYIITKLVLDSLLAGEKISVIDCGARGGGVSDWASLGKYITLYGFDPDKNECDRLNAQAIAAGLNHTYYPFCLAEKNDQNRDFYIAKSCDSSSLYQPNEKLITRFKQSLWGKTFYTSDKVGLERIEKVNTTNIDTWAEANNIRDIDFIKLDVQGAELEVLKGGQNLLKSALGLNIETWFQPVYKGIPLFSDIDIYVRSWSFEFFSMHTYTSGQFVGRRSSPIIFDKVNTYWEQQLAGQLATADVFYLKDPLNSMSQYPDDNKILKLCCLAEMCQQIDFSFELLSYLKDKFEQNGEKERSKLAAEVYSMAARQYPRKKKEIYFKDFIEHRILHSIKSIKKRMFN